MGYSELTTKINWLTQYAIYCEEMADEMTGQYLHYCKQYGNESVMAINAHRSRAEYSIHAYNAATEMRHLQDKHRRFFKAVV